MINVFFLENQLAAEFTRSNKICIELRILLGVKGGQSRCGKEDERERERAGERERKRKGGRKREKERERERKRRGGGKRARK